MASKEVIGLLKDFRELLICRICNVSNTHHIDWYRCAHLHPICELCRWNNRCSCGQEILEAHDKLVKSLLTNKKLGHGQLIRRHFEYPCLVVRELQVTVQELNAVHVQFGAVLCIRVTCLSH